MREAARLVAPESITALVEGMVAAFDRLDPPRSVEVTIDVLRTDGTWLHGAIRLEVDPAGSET